MLYMSNERGQSPITFLLYEYPVLDPDLVHVSLKRLHHFSWEAHKNHAAAGDIVELELCRTKLIHFAAQSNDIHGVLIMCVACHGSLS